MIVAEGLRGALPKSQIAIARGCAVERGEKGGIASAREITAQSDVIVLCLGETLAMSGEAGSRGDPGLPQAQLALARSVLAQGKSVIVLLFSGRPLILPNWLVEKAAAVMAVWFLGSEAARAIGDVLSGRSNPSGRLTMSWPVDVGQIPIFFAQRPTGRPADPGEHYTSKYLDMPNAPRFPFGHGLSYGNFRLGGLQLDRSELRPGDTVEIIADVTNEGTLAGEETLYLFIRDLVSSVSRPMLELKDFCKITLDAGQRGIARFRLDASDLAFLGPDLEPKLEAGEFEIHVGQSAAPEGMLTARLVLRDG
jgi:beta-glucosidase